MKSFAFPSLTRLRGCLIFGICGMLGLTALSGESNAQTVQLPSIQRFSYSGGVLVPDGGSVYLGGNKSYATSSGRRGIPGLPSLPGSGVGSSMRAGGASLSATIIDHQEIDRQLLGEDAHSLARRIRNEKRAGLSLASDADRLAEAKSLVRNARNLYKAGRRSSSKQTYELAISQLRKIRYESQSNVARLDYLIAFATNEFSSRFPLTESLADPTLAARTRR